MRRRKATTMQVNARLETELVDRLGARAKENRVSLSEEIKTRLINSFKPEPSLADFRGDWMSRLRNTLEHIARQEGIDIEAVWRVVQVLEVKWGGLYTDVENELSPHVRYPQIRELLRGAPTLPHETKTKAAQRE